MSRPAGCSPTVAAALATLAVAVLLAPLTGCRKNHDAASRRGASAATSAGAASGSAQLSSAAVPATSTSTPAPPPESPPEPVPPRGTDPGPGAMLTPSPLGPPDAIEPPTRAIVPGMTVAQARAAGAKGKEPWLEVTPDITAWVQNKTSRVYQLEVSYEKRRFEALKATWGAPNLGEAWVGKNWYVTANGCKGSAGSECGATFMRAPGGMLPSRPRPPGAFAELRYGMTAAEVKARFGTDFEDITPVEVGYPLSVRLRYSRDKRLEYIELHASGLNATRWKPLLESLWGKPKELSGGAGEKEVWSAPAEGWHAIFEEFPGVVVTFGPLVPFASAVAPSAPRGFVHLAKDMLGKPAASLAVIPGYDRKNEELYLPATEYSLRETRLVPKMDGGKVVSVNVILEIPSEKREEASRTLFAALGAKPKPKPENESDEVELFTLEATGATGLELQREKGSDSFELLPAKK